MSTESNPLLAALADLRARRAKLDAAIDALEGALQAQGMSVPAAVATAAPQPLAANGPAAPVAPPAVPESAPGAIPREMLYGRALPEACKLVLMARNRPMSLDEITAELVASGVAFAAKDPASSVSFALNRAKHAKLLERVKGLWQVPAWSKDTVRGRNINEHAANTRKGLALAKERGIKLGRPSHLTPEQRAEIVAAIEGRPKGMSRRAKTIELSERFGVHVQTVTNIWRAASSAKAEAQEDASRAIQMALDELDPNSGPKH
jgi:hypothetical protein